MSVYIALLRAVNVGGTGKLPMSDLKTLCEQAGFTAVRTYIASGNVVFECRHSESRVKAELEARLKRYAGKPVDVLLRSPSELAKILKKNPFPDKAPNHTVVIFLDAPPPRNALNEINGRKDEEVRQGTREFYVYYGEDMGKTRLKIPAARAGTARNINTISKLIEMAKESPGFTR